MARPKAEWDPSWDDDWQAVQGELKDQIQEARPHPPGEAVNLYRYGFGRALQQPSREWSDVESEMYQDYMGGAPEPTGEPASTNMDWEEATDWARRGWHAARGYKD